MTGKTRFSLVLLALGAVQEVFRNDDGVITGVQVLNTLVTYPVKQRD